MVKNPRHFTKTKSNRGFWSTSLGEKLKDLLDVAIAVALIQGIDDED